MNLAIRDDGIVLNLGAALTFTPINVDSMVVEFPGNVHYIIYDCTILELSEEQIHYKQWRGWPE